MGMYQPSEEWIEENNYEPCLYIVKLAIIRATVESPYEKEIAENNYNEHLAKCKHCKLFVDELLEFADEVESYVSMQAS